MAVPDWLEDGRECSLPEIEAILSGRGETLADYVIDIEDEGQMTGYEMRSSVYLTPEEAFGAIYFSGIDAFSAIGYVSYLDFETGEDVEYYVVVVAYDSGGA